MPSLRPSAARTFRASLSSPSTASPFRTQPGAPPCRLCAHCISPQPTWRRFQSSASASASNSKETPFDSQTSTQQNPSPAQAQTQAQAQTHYTFFPQSLPHGPPPKGPFTIDLAALKKEFLQLQARAHPDLHPPSSKKRAEALSATINTAYKTLQSPLHRAQYILSLRGIHVAEDETAKVADPELLMEVLEAREAVEEAEKEADLEGLRTVNEQRIRESIGRMEAAFNEDDLGRVAEEVVRLRYWVNIQESIEAWERGAPVVLKH
ncbi:Co-chaperone Hsc20 [Decorospora gaudefroyi]|uniref:Co-chaperone Hsc20 n=1 Tax=Decorospora gaudefroyi TaxID=184978 RepID=A0A6A5K710_9PLEO|nr:Co-chaperone Hsc20 [Decorospora gaudefroyi]